MDNLRSVRRNRTGLAQRPEKSFADMHGTELVAGAVANLHFSTGYPMDLPILAFLGGALGRLTGWTATGGNLVVAGLVCTSPAPGTAVIYEPLRIPHRGRVEAAGAAGTPGRAEAA